MKLLLDEMIGPAPLLSAVDRVSGDPLIGDMTGIIRRNRELLRAFAAELKPAF